ncbi:hypothetical protein H0H93_014155 [Arthromyces matolae]|nr:hypothetical protein H0H93_014155 [Arthromyces matolae]
MIHQSPSKQDEACHPGRVLTYNGLRRVEAANNGNAKAFQFILDLAYGRKGKLRWELMKPLLSHPNAQTSQPIIPSVPKSRPPVFSPELKALMLSSDSRTTKPLTAKSLEFPPLLPARADPTSEDARLLGPFSKRREVNIRWRYFTQEWKKVLPPLQVVISNTSPDVESSDVSDDAVIRAGIRRMGMQGNGIFEGVCQIVGPLTIPRPQTRKERLSSGVSVGALEQTRHPSRWLRRRYQELLGRLPVLKYTTRNGECVGRYSVTLSPTALAPSLRHDPSRYSEVEPEADLEWLEFGNTRLLSPKKGSRTKR